MNIEDIDSFLRKNTDPETGYVKISFKKRDDIYGLFIKDRDYDHLRSKNFWRIVTRLHATEFQRSGDKSLAKIFNGAEFSRLTRSLEVI
jgi:hypothetical protein